MVPFLGMLMGELSVETLSWFLWAAFAAGLLAGAVKALKRRGR